VVLGSGVTGAGMTIDNTEFGRITTGEAGKVSIYAGSQAAGATARGDITVGDLVINGTTVGRTELFAANGHDVTIRGQVDAGTAGKGVLAVGTPSAASGWTPDSIIITGAIGRSTTNNGQVFTQIAGLGGVELNAVDNVIIGTQAFVDAVLATPASGINIARNVPNIRAEGTDINKVFVTAGSMSVRADGRVVSQNTSRANGRPVGMFLTNGTPVVTTLLGLGRTGGPGAGGALIPELIDLSMSVINGDGKTLAGQLVAASGTVSLLDMTPNNAYRVNGCTIAAPGQCTPINERLIDLPVDNLVTQLLSVPDEAPLLNDPTITGAGNEEIWRTPDVAQEEEEEEE